MRIKQLTRISDISAASRALPPLHTSSSLQNHLLLRFLFTQRETVVSKGIKTRDYFNNCRRKDSFSCSRERLSFLYLLLTHKNSLCECSWFIKNHDCCRLGDIVESESLVSDQRFPDLWWVTSQRQWRWSEEMQNWKMCLAWKDGEKKQRLCKKIRLTA